jgi:hypothetical protein
MRTILLSTVCGLLTMFLAGLVGCGQSKTPRAGGAAASRPHSHSHGHTHSGIHGGQVIELDTEQHHAEITHDEATQKVGVYMLDAEASATTPIEAASVIIEVSAAGEQTQYTLPAVAQPGEEGGKSSYFELVSEPLQTIVSGHAPSPRKQAIVKISTAGKTYEGEIDTSEQAHDSGHVHSHGPDDALVWLKEISEQDYKIALGHHGVILFAGGKVEPAVQITSGEEPVADAQVFNALLAADGKVVLAEEVATAYEPPTDDEPSHYAQGGLKIPSGTRQMVIRYRIVLPEGKGEHTFDVPVAVK